MTMRRVTEPRFAMGMTFDDYVTYVGTDDNLAREAGWWLGVQADAIRWLAARPDGPAKILVISEEWSSDCRRDVPMLARLAAAGGLALRIFTRDGAKVGRGASADPSETPNADLANATRAARSGEAPERAWARFVGEWRALQESPFFAMWASAAVDEMLSALHERVVVGGPA
jgi:hypothetical protein